MKILRYLIYFIFITFLFGACFSFWNGDEDNLTIVWGNTGNNRNFVSEEDLPNLRFTVTLTGPGSKQEETFTGVPSASFKVIPGLWTVTIKGEGPNSNETVPGLEYDLELKVMGIEQVQVTDGRNDPKSIKIYTVTEVNSWVELNFAINLSSTYSEFDIEYPREELIILRDGEAGYIPVSTLETINIQRPIILISEVPVEIVRVSTSYSLFAVGMNGSLTLGLNGMPGTITIRGGDVGSPDTLIRVEGNDGNASLVINSGVTLTEGMNHFDPLAGSGTGNGGAVTMRGQNALFSLNGGSIKGNFADKGGGVFITEGAKFYMYSGSISGNNAEEIAEENAFGDGGGVYMEGDSVFEMHGGSISGNFAARRGGGVYSSRSASFSNYGGTISNNKSELGANVYIETII